MTQVTVKELAQVVDTPVERLLQQMREAGLPHTSAEQVVTDNEKQARRETGRAAQDHLAAQDHHHPEGRR